MAAETPKVSGDPGRPHRHHHHVIAMPSPPQKHYHHRPHGPSCCFCCLWVLLFLFLLLAFFFATVAVIYFWLRPQAPDFRIESFNVTTLHVSEHDSLTFLKSNIDLHLEAWNRNDVLNFRYGRFLVNVYTQKDKVRLGRALGDPFVLTENNMTVLKVLGGEENAAVNPWMGREMEQQVKERRLVVEVQVEGYVDFVVGNSCTGEFPMKVVCEGVRLSEGGEDFDPKCRVYLYDWLSL